MSQFSESGLDFFSLFVVDLMHEFELGVWKAVLTHLIRILHTHPGMIGEFDQRYVTFFISNFSFFLINA